MRYRCDFDSYPRIFYGQYAYSCALKPKSTFFVLMSENLKTTARTSSSSSSSFNGRCPCYTRVPHIKLRLVMWFEVVFFYRPDALPLLLLPGLVQALEDYTGRFSAARPGPFTAAKKRPGPARVDTYSWPGPGNILPLIYSIKRQPFLMLRCFLQVPVTKQVVQYMRDKTKILCSTS